MPRFKEGDRICLRVNTQCTGLVVTIQDTGYDWHNKLIGVQWDTDNWSNPVWYRAQELDLISNVAIGTDHKEKEQNMSQALWCDKGAHAFSAKDPDREHYTSTKNVRDGQLVTQVTAELDICGACMRDTSFSEVPAIAGSVVQDKVPGQE